MKASRTARRCSMLVIASFIALSATNSFAQETSQEMTPIPWDQEKMTKLTSDLHDELKGVRDSFRKDPSFTDPGTMKRRVALEMRDHLRVLEVSARQLATKVKKGENMEQTTPVARKIGSLLRDVEVLSRQMQSSMWLQERARLAMNTLNLIAPYYGVTQLYDVDKMRMLPREPGTSAGADGGAS